MKPAVHTGIVGAVIGYFLGHWLGNHLSSDYAQNALSDTNNFPIVLGYLLGVVGWLAGLGVFNDIGRLMMGKPLRDVEHAPAGGLAKYFRYTLDHKVVGIQYLFGMITYFLPAACSPWRSAPSCCRRPITCCPPTPISWWWASTAR